MCENLTLRGAAPAGRSTSESSGGQREMWQRSARWRPLARCVGTALGLVAFILAAVPAAPVSAAPVITRQLVSVDTTTDPNAQHNTEINPDSFSWGSTVVATYQVGRFNAGGSAADIGWATSTNGGSSWQSGLLPSLTASSTPVGPYPRAVDANVAYDDAHGVWMISSIQVGLVGGSYNEIQSVVSRSTNGGASWQAPVTITAQNQPDKGWLTCDNVATSPHRGTCYYVYTADLLNGQVLASRSTDGGLTWSAPVATPSGGTGLDMIPVVRPDGTVVVVGATLGEHDVMSYRSTDGGLTWTDPVVITPMQKHAVATMRAYFKPAVDIDPNGTVWATWADCRFRAGCSTNDIVYVTSADGTTWSAPTRLPTDPVTSTIEHYIPSLAVDQDAGPGPAHVGIELYEEPTTPCGAFGQPTCQIEAVYLYSGDGGASWSAAAHLSPSLALSTWYPQATSGRAAGDYEAAAFSGGNAVIHYPVASAPSGTTYHVDMYASVVGALPPNAAPTARMTTSCFYGTCALDGTGSSDPDGTVAQWSWDFGDGRSGSGATVSHAYSASGTYTVGLTVTDDTGATSSTTRQLVVSVPAALPVAADAFGRTTSGGWGLADVGGAWTAVSGPATAFATDGTVGSVSTPPATSREIVLGGTSVGNVDLLASVRTTGVPTSFGETTGLVVRRTAANTEYRARLRFTSTGATLLGIFRLNASTTEVAVGSEVAVPGVTYAPGTLVRTRV